MDLVVRRDGDVIAAYRLNLPPCPGAYLVTGEGDPVAECIESGEWRSIVTIEEGQEEDAAQEG